MNCQSRIVNALSDAPKQCVEGQSSESPLSQGKATPRKLTFIGSVSRLLGQPRAPDSRSSSRPARGAPLQTAERRGARTPGCRPRLIKLPQKVLERDDDAQFSREQLFCLLLHRVAMHTAKRYVIHSVRRLVAARKILALHFRSVQGVWVALCRLSHGKPSRVKRVFISSLAALAARNGSQVPALRTASVAELAEKRRLAATRISLLAMRLKVGHSFLQWKRERLLLVACTRLGSAIRKLAAQRFAFFAQAAKSAEVRVRLGFKSALPSCSDEWSGLRAVLRVLSGIPQCAQFASEYKDWSEDSGVIPPDLLACLPEASSERPHSPFFSLCELLRACGKAARGLFRISFVDVLTCQGCGFISSVRRHASCFDLCPVPPHCIQNGLTIYATADFFSEELASAPATDEQESAYLHCLQDCFARLAPQTQMTAENSLEAVLQYELRLVRDSNALYCRKCGGEQNHLRQSFVRTPPAFLLVTVRRATDTEFDIPGVLRLHGGVFNLRFAVCQPQPGRYIAETFPACSASLPDSLTNVSFVVYARRESQGSH